MDVTYVLEGPEGELVELGLQGQRCTLRDKGLGTYETTHHDSVQAAKVALDAEIVHLMQRGYHLLELVEPVDDASQQEFWGRLRELLHHASPSHWEALCDLVEDRIAQRDLDPEMIAYARQHLAGWPETMLRAAPDTWLQRLIRHQRAPELAFCNAIMLEGYEFRASQFARVLAECADQGIDTLILPGCTAQRAMMSTLLASPLAEHLRVLDVSLGEPAHLDWSEALAAHPRALCRLEALDLSGGLFPEHALEALVDSAQLEALKILRLSGCDLHDRAVEIVAQTKGLPALRLLDLTLNVIQTDVAPIEARGIEVLVGEQYLRRTGDGYVARYGFVTSREARDDVDMLRRRQHQADGDLLSRLHSY